VKKPKIVSEKDVAPGVTGNVQSGARSNDVPVAVPGRMVPVLRDADGEKSRRLQP